MPDYLPLPIGPSGLLRVDFDDAVGAGDRVHLLSATDIHAVNAALAAGRPLLVRGEPGVGKSQLARAAARELRRPLIVHAVDSHTESRDLLWRFDAVRRLAEAQLAGALRTDPDSARAALAVERFVEPGPLWWAFAWDDAAAQCARADIAPVLVPEGCDPANGCVLLLDEMDKAEPEVPNGLLEALGAREFTPFGRTAPVRAASRLPLVIVTTNEERALPDAFLRRCLVHRLSVPEDKGHLKRFLVERGRAHFADAPEDVLARAADLVVRDRGRAREAEIRPFPGQAEYLDLIRAVLGLAEDTPGRLALLDLVAPFALSKQAAADP